MVGLLNLSWCATIFAIVSLCLVSAKFKSYLAATTVILNAVITSLLAIGALNGEIKEILFQGNIFWGDILIRIDGL